MIRYRAIIVMGACLAALLYLGAWRAADHAPGVLSTGEGLALPLDDAAIYLQYAHEAGHGEWLSYNPGSALSTGVTSWLYFGLLSALMALGLPGAVSAWLLGLASLLAGLVAAERLGRLHLCDLPPWWAPLLLLSQGAWVAWHFNGMETGLFLALSWLMALAALEDRPRLLLGTAAALAFTRPEGQVLALALGAAWAWPRAERWRRLGPLLLLVAAPSALLWALSGSGMPDSMRPKAAALLEGQDAWSLMARSSDYAVGVLKGAWSGFYGSENAVGLAGTEAAQNPVSMLFPPLLLLVALVGFFEGARGRQRLFWTALAAALAAVFALLAWQLPVGWHDHRYLAASAPLLLLAGLRGLQALRSQGGLGRSAAAAVFGLWVAFGLASWPWQWQRCYQGARLYALSNRNAGVALRGLPPGPVLVADAGLIAWASGRPIVDLLGITDHKLALAQTGGRGAVLEELLHRREAPVWAALQEHRPDVDLAPWLRMGLLQPLDLPPPGEGIRLYRWDPHDSRLQGQPTRLPNGGSLIGELNVALAASEARLGYRAEGPDSARTRALDRRLPGSPALVAEGGRQVLSDAFIASGDGLILRAVFDRPGRVLVYGGGQQPRLLAVSTVSASPGDAYTELAFRLPDAVPGRALRVAFEDEKGQPTPWVSCHYWFTSSQRPD